MFKREHTRDFILSPDKGERITSLVLHWAGGDGFLLGFTLTTLDGSGKARRWCANSLACVDNDTKETLPLQVRITNHVNNVYLDIRFRNQKYNPAACIDWLL